MAVKKPYFPNHPVEYEKADVAAIQALARGDATPDQQIRALKYIVNDVARTYDSHFFDSERHTNFALGKGFVGQQIVKLTKLNMSTVFGSNPNDEQGD